MNASAETCAIDGVAPESDTAYAQELIAAGLWSGRVGDCYSTDGVGVEWRPSALGGVSKYLGSRRDAFTARRGLVTKYAWAIPTVAVLRRIAALGPIIEVGAGSGYWAMELVKLGADIIATDARAEGWVHSPEPHHPVATMDATSAVRTHGAGRALMLVWPSYDDPWSGQALEAYEAIGGRTVIYVGESRGGCTADDAFHERLAKSWTQEDIEIPQWYGIHDYLTIAKRVTP